MPLPRLVRLVSSVALFASLPGNAFAEQPAPPRDAQLDRIEQKLDDVLKRLGAGGAPPAQTEKTPESENRRELSARRAGDRPRRARVGAASFRDSRR